MTTYYVEPIKKSPAVSVAARIWILTSLVLGAGWGLYFTVLQDDDAGLFILITMGAAICSLPVVLVLALLLPYIDNLRFQPVVKIRRVALACLGCVSVYGLLISADGTKSYNNPQFLQDYSIHFLVATSVLFSCSVVAIFLSNKALARFFAVIPENIHPANETLTEEDATDSN